MSDKDLHFELAGKVYDVPVGGTCEVPDRIAYAIESRGLPMKPAAELESAAKPAPAVDEMSEAELETATAPKADSSSRKRK